MPKVLKKDRPAPVNVIDPPPAAIGAAYGPITAPPSLGPTAPSPTFLVPLPVSPQADNLTPLAIGSESSEEEEDDPVSSDKEDSDDGKEHSDDKEFSTNVGPDSYISKKMMQVEDLLECAAIVKLVTARFKYLNCETCLCGKRLTKNYVESRTCKTCTLVEKKKAAPMCTHCHLITLKGKWIDIGYCKQCLDALQRVKKIQIVKK